MFAPPTAIYTHGSGLSKYYFYAIPRSLLDIVNRCKSHMPMIYLPPEIFFVSLKSTKITLKIQISEVCDL
jgi:hypothetical protein